MKLKVITSALLLAMTACSAKVQMDQPAYTTSVSQGPNHTITHESKALSLQTAPSAGTPPASSTITNASTSLSTFDTRPTILIPAKADVAATLNASKPNTIYMLSPNLTYVVNGTITLNQPNVSWNLNGSTVELNSSVGAFTNVAIKAAHIEIYNGTITKANGGFRSWADSTSIHHIKTTNVIGQFFLGDIGSTNAKIDSCTIGMTGSVGIYFTQDNMTISNTTMAGSQGEYDIREEIIALPTLPKNALISNVTADNRKNIYNKSAIGIRMGSATIENSKIYGDIRVGQSGATAVGSNNPSFVIRNTQFLSAHSPELSLIKGVNAIVDHCTFTSDTLTRVMAIDGLTKAVLTNNIIKGPVKPGGSSPSGLWGTVAVPPPQVIETGTVKIP